MTLYTCTVLYSALDLDDSDLLIDLSLGIKMDPFQGPLDTYALRWGAKLSNTIKTQYGNPSVQCG